MSDLKDTDDRRPAPLGDGVSSDATKKMPLVCCVKWGTRYQSTYVNRLRRMVARNLAAPHEFVCLTEDPEGLDAGIRSIPLPDDLHGYWNKLSLFRDDLFEAGRTVLYFDLDVVITGSLDFLLEGGTGLAIIKEFGGNPGFNSSVMRFPAGAYAAIYERYVASADTISSDEFPGDQDWIFHQVPDAECFPDGKIVSFKKGMKSRAFARLRKLGFKHLPRTPHWMTVEPPASASVVVFHGKPDPQDVMDAPYRQWKRAPFVREHWR